MITRDLLKNIIQEGKEIIRDVQLHQRPFEYEPNARYVMVGVRQAGKSYTLYQNAKRLIEEGYEIEQFAYLDFEVDFFIPEQKLAIQVAYSVLASENINTQERELAGLDKLSKRFPDIKLLIITFDEEGEVESKKKGNKVEILPAWKFLLS